MVAVLADDLAGALAVGLAAALVVTDFLAAVAFAGAAFAVVFVGALALEAAAVLVAVALGVGLAAALALEPAALVVFFAAVVAGFLAAVAFLAVFDDVVALAIVSTPPFLLRRRLVQVFDLPSDGV